jgi:hypothetical protein
MVFLDFFVLFLNFAERREGRYNELEMKRSVTSIITGFSIVSLKPNQLVL